MAKKIKLKRPFASVRAHQGDIHKPLIKPPKLLRATPSFTVKDLFKRVDEKKRTAAKEIAIKTMKTMIAPSSGRIIPADTTIYRVQTYSKHNKHIHNVTIMLRKEELPFSEYSKPIIDCSCSSHIFHCEYNLAKRGNAFLWRSNGDAPLVNTKLTICKHCFVALRYMVRKANANTLPKKTVIQKKLSFARGT